MSFTVSGNLVDITSKAIYPAQVHVEQDTIIAIERLPEGTSLSNFIIPGFIDSHVHIESSMLIPSEFARLAVVHGTVATVSDPHEIANVCGIDGVNFMIDDGKKVPFKFYFGAPSCVPATSFETAGASLGPKEVEDLLKRDDVHYLSEMMNFPGVLFGDEDVLAKISLAKKFNKPVDGHAPGLSGEKAKQYIGAGISTDHECFTEEEALEKLKYGMKILIREGSAARNFDALINLLADYPDSIMYCSDDKHPDSLVEGHINQLCARAVEKGIDVFKVLQAACVNPVKHYKLKVGLLRKDDKADFLLVRDLQSFEVLQTFINGELVAEKGLTKIHVPEATTKVLNRFNCSKKHVTDFEVKVGTSVTIPVIEALDGQLVTTKLDLEPTIRDGKIVADPDRDILKIAVVNRYHDAPIALSFIKNFGLKKGAIASSVAHDSHNIIVVGVDDKSICEAVNALIEVRGGVCAIDAGTKYLLPLPVGGLMTAEDGYKVAEDYKAIDAAAKRLGSGLGSPFMTLSFMALLVIPELKLSDKGLFNGNEFKFVS